MPKRTEEAEEDTSNRRRQLARWIDAHYEGKGKQAAFVKEHGLNQGLISALLNDENKSFGGVKARNLEKQAKMPKRYLEQRDQEVPPPVKVAGPRDDAHEPDFHSFKDRVASDSDWGLLQAAKLILSDEQKKKLTEQFEELERRAKEAYEQKMAEKPKGE